ncbi:hypothetical protein INT43_001187 [Umbelopsis isabellina]|uniref:C3H1-type domain-containing protein n=1 Tax=Mortierella isabellina TaxID=91625 RepID=A0A8H7PKR7_MORIS|nr:hypothetical protein INT43_001187 [Umbelopsis isabellina]
MLNQPQIRRFPPPCRFYSKGTCRAGESCLFAHILQATPMRSESNLQKNGQSDAHSRTDHIAGVTARRSSTVRGRDAEFITTQMSQLSQLEHRYKSSFSRWRDAQGNTVVQIALVLPADFTYDLSSLIVHIVVSNNYPQCAATIKVQNTNIPKGFAINLERAFNERMEGQLAGNYPTLLERLDWFENNMEQLLSQPPTTTMRFVRNNSIHPVTSTNSIEPLPKTRAKPSDERKQTPSQKRYTFEQLEKAKIAKDRHLKQLETRFPDSYRVLKSNKEKIEIYLEIKLTDPEFGFRDIFGDSMDLNIIVPDVYPLEPCQMEIISDKLEDWRLLNIAHGFQRHVTEAPSSLFQHLNWLVRNLSDLMKEPPRRASIQSSQVQSSISLPISKPKVGAGLVPDDAIIKPKKVVITNSAEFYPPALVEQFSKQRLDEHINASTSESSASSSDSEPISFSSKSSNPRGRGGIELRHPDVSLENIALLQLDSLNISVKCTRCRSKFSIMDLDVEILDKSSDEASATNPQMGERWLACPTCTQILGIKIFPGMHAADLITYYVHENSPMLGLLQTAKCVPIAMLPSRYLAICARCDSNCQNRIIVASFGQKVTVACRSCHVPLSLDVQKCKMIRIGALASDWLQADEYEISKLQKKGLQEKSVNKISLGQLTYNQGPTKYGYLQAFSWMRFECCNRVYACDKCHDEAESHIYEICGYCSKEQPYHQQRCMGCDKLLTGAYNHPGSSKKTEVYKNRAHDLVKSKAGPQSASKKEHRAELQ